jgi:hypothetical protein
MTSMRPRPAGLLLPVFLAAGVVALPGETRRNPIDLAGWWWTRPMGLRVLDFQLPLGNLVEQVHVRLARPAPAP